MYETSASVYKLSYGPGSAARSAPQRASATELREPSWRSGAFFVGKGGEEEQGGGERGQDDELRHEFGYGSAFEID